MTINYDLAGAKVTPLAKRIADDRGIDVSAVQGSGYAGRIFSRDLDNIAGAESIKPVETGPMAGTGMPRLMTPLSMAGGAPSPAGIAGQRAAVFDKTGYLTDDPAMKPGSYTEPVSRMEPAGFTAPVSRMEPESYAAPERRMTFASYTAPERRTEPESYAAPERRMTFTNYEAPERRTEPASYATPERRTEPASYVAPERRMAPASYEAPERRMAPASYEAPERRMDPASYAAPERRMEQASYEAPERRMEPASYEVPERRMAPASFETIERRTAPESYAAPERRTEPASYAAPERRMEPASFETIERRTAPESYAAPERRTAPASYEAPERRTEPASYETIERLMEPASYTAPERRTEPESFTAPERRMEPASYAAPERRTEPASYEAPERRTEPSSYTAPERRTEPESYTAPERRMEPASYAALERRTEPEADAAPESRIEPADDAAPESRMVHTLHAVPDNRISPEDYIAPEAMPAQAPVDPDAGYINKPSTGAMIAAAISADHDVAGVMRMNDSRRSVADASAKSASQTAAVTQHMETDITALLSLLGRINAGAEKYKYIPIAAFYIKALAVCVREKERFRMRLSDAGDTYLLMDGAHIGFQLVMGDALVTPVIRSADIKPLEEIAAEVILLGEKAKRGDILDSDCRGGVLTLLDKGESGIYAFTPIIKQPESAIAGIGAPYQRLIMTERGIENRHFVMQSLTFDHRVINGREADEFQRRLKEILEEPGPFVG